MAWSPIERLTHEFDAIGFYLSGHPLDDYKIALRRSNVRQFVDLQNTVEKEVLIAGTIAKIDQRTAKSGKSFRLFGFVRPVWSV